MSADLLTDRKIEHLLTSHPLRPRIVALCEQEPHSPRAIATELETSLGVIAYHVRTLAHAGALELVSERMRRGAVEHFYRATTAGQVERANTPLEMAVRALEAIAAGEDLYADRGYHGPTATAQLALQEMGRRDH